jgi:YVTN family beta-propeller protein
MHFSIRPARVFVAALFAGAGLMAVAPGGLLGTRATASAAQRPHTTPAAPLEYVADSGTASLDEVNGTTGSVISQIPVGADPYAVAVTPDGSTAWVVDKTGDKIYPVNVATGTVGTAVVVGSSPEAIAITPDGTTAFVANSVATGGSATVTPVQLSSGGTGVALTPIVIGSAQSQPAAVAITPNGKTAFVADHGQGQVVPITVSTLKAGTPIVIGSGSNPQALAITPDGTTLLVVANGNNTVVPVDTATNTIGTPVPVGSGPDAIAVNPTGTLAYVPNFANNNVTPITISSGAGTAHTPFNVGQQPTGVAFSPGGSIAYVTNFTDGSITPVTVTTSSGIPSTADALPPGPALQGSPPSHPAAVAFVPDEGPIAHLVVGLAQAGSPTTFDASASTPGSTPIASYAFSFGDGSAKVISSADVQSHTYELAGTYTASVTVTDTDGVSTTSIFTGQTASGNAILTSGGSPEAAESNTFSVQAATSAALPVAYVADAGTGHVTPMAVVANVAGTPISFPGTSAPDAVAVTPDGNTAIVTDKGSSQLRLIDTAFNASLGSLTVGPEPVALAISPDGSKAYVADAGNGQVSIVNLITRTVTAVTVGTSPAAVAFTPDGSLAFVANSGDGTVSVIDVTSGAVINTLHLGASTSPDALSVTPNGTTVWVGEAGSGAVRPLTVAAAASGQTAIGTGVPVGVDPDALAITPNGQGLLVANGGSGTVTPIGISSTPVVGSPVTVGTVAHPTSGAPSGLAVTPSGTTLLVTDSFNNMVDQFTVTTSGGTASLAPGSQLALSSGDAPAGVAVVPDLHPIASFTASPALAPAATVFDASGSLGPSSAIVSYAWTFGDGQSATTTSDTESHVYATPGTYTATVTETDADGGSTTPVYTGQTASASGGATAEFSQTFTINPPLGPPVITGVSPTTGPTGGGTAVSITGTGFSGTTAVDFGAAPGAITQVTATTITVTSPPGSPGQADLSVTTPGGTSAPSPADGFTYVTRPAVSAVRPDTGPISGGTIVTLTGSNFGGSPTVTIGGQSAQILSSTANQITALTPANPAGPAAVVVTGQGIPSAPGAFTYVVPGSGGVGGCSSALAGPVVGMALTPDGGGYWIVNAAGQIVNRGDAVCYGSMLGTTLKRPIVGITLDPLTGGYWLVASDGGIFSFDAPFFGSTGDIVLNKPVVGMAATPSGRGYLFVASDGGVFTYGDAQFHGSTGSLVLNSPVVGMALSPDGGGYVMAATDGGVFAFGNAPFLGSLGSTHLNKPVVGIAADQATGGYWMVASDGGIFSFHARFLGSTGALRLVQPVVGMAATTTGDGYVFIAADGGVFNYGTQSFFGSGVSS